MKMIEPSNIIGIILLLFGNTLDWFTEWGYRHPNSTWNNICRSTNMLTSACSPYYGCAEQAEYIEILMNDLGLDDIWNFDWHGEWLTWDHPFPHQWIEATSNNPDDPIVIIDQHHGTFDYLFEDQ